MIDAKSGLQKTSRTPSAGKLAQSALHSRQHAKCKLHYVEHVECQFYAQNKYTWHNHKDYIDFSLACTEKAQQNSPSRRVIGVGSVKSDMDEEADRDRIGRNMFSTSLLIRSNKFS